MELIEISPTTKELRRNNRVLCTFVAQGRKRLVEVSTEGLFNGYPVTRLVPLGIDEITTVSEADAIRKAVLSGDYDSDN